MQYKRKLAQANLPYLSTVCIKITRLNTLFKLILGPSGAKIVTLNSMIILLANY